MELEKIIIFSGSNASKEDINALTYTNNIT